jgi:molecular chaperone DnaK (HSP70)
MARYLVGIDLGTTNSALAYVDSRGKGQPRLNTLLIPQLVGPNDVVPRPLLPSYLYLPGPHDLPAGACALPWDPQRAFAVGEFARLHGARVPGRLVTSAKSWLCHAGVDRSAPILPWSAPPDVPRLSPVEASTRYLKHLAEAWNFVIARERAEDFLEKQAIVLTVPASFDDMARSLTVEAARKAGFENLTLLEEPQAAFYCWVALARGSTIHGPAGPMPAARQPELRPGMRCLVIDVGGGTSDFSLIESVEDEGDLGFVRQAVGDHLLLGGDNMDLALARHVEKKLPGSAKLDATGLGQLVQACRLAKETLLAPDGPAEYTVTVMGRGRQVIGGAVSAVLTPDEVRRTLEEGFFPQVASSASPQRAGRTGLHEMGLPYVQDAAITRHLAGFLHEHGVTPERPPDAILFNGGVFQPLAIRQRILDVLGKWYSSPGRPWEPVVLANPSLDLAVAWGAAYFAWLKHTGGKRIGGGLARSYYLGIGTDKPAAADAESLDLLCIVPQHLEEGSAITLEQPELELALGQPVTFPLYTSTVRGADQPGQMLRLQPRQLLRLPPLHTVLRGGKRSGTKSVPVKLAARLTEIGTLELACVARNSDQRWRLEFNTRDLVLDAEDGDGVGEALVDVWPEEKVQAAAACLRSAFGSQDERPVKEVVRSLEAALEAGREHWPTALCRRLWDILAELAEQRRRSPAHLARWYNLVGWCLRPGFGDPLDRYRVEQLWKLLHGAPKQPASQASRAGEGGADWWIMWRRVSGGLNATLQQALLERLKPVLLPARSGKGAVYKPGAHELAEMWRAAASMERVEAKWKEQLGQTLLKSVRRSPVPTYAFWALTRLGTRRLLYGPLNAIVHPQIVERWLEPLLGFTPGNDSERQGWLFCLAQLSQRTGQLALDVGDSARQQVLAVLRGAGAAAHLITLVEEGGQLEASEQRQLLGDTLPIGLRLIAPVE